MAQEPQGTLFYPPPLKQNLNLSAKDKQYARSKERDYWNLVLGTLHIYQKS